MTIGEKTSYLKGFVDALKLDESQDEVKIIKKMLEILDEAALTIADLEERVDELELYTDELDEDLGEVEEVVYDIPPHHHHCDCDDEIDDYCDCGCDCDDEYDEDFDEDDFDEDEELIEVCCPACDESICLPPTIDLDHVICPACGAEFSCICDCEDCDCDCDDCDCDECED